MDRKKHTKKPNENVNTVQKIKYAGIFRKIDDIPDLRIELENVFNSKSHKEMVEYGLLLGRHILKMTNTDPCNEITESFEINKRWLNGETGKGFAKFQIARNAAGKLLDMARDEKDPIKEKMYRVMAQIANTPHVKNHALWASDYAVKLINTMYPNNFEEVKKEREIQIELMRGVFMDGFNADLHTQIKLLEKILRSSEVLHDVCMKAQKLDLQNYYIGAGCIAQTVWNNQMNFDVVYGISDIDFVYYDSSDISFEAENATIEYVKNGINPCPIKLDIKNQARVHLWYRDHFGYDIKPYASIEEAINTWPTTATSIGVRFENEKMKLYAPFGLNDLFGMIVRANKTQITEEIYMQKANKWKAKWPALTIVPW